MNTATEKCFNFNARITQDAVRTMLIDALEQGSYYWCEFVESTGPLGLPSGDFKAADIVLNGGEVILREQGEENNLTLNYASVLIGLNVMAVKYPKVFARVLLEEFDAEIGDIFLQLCLLREIKYG